MGFSGACLCGVPDRISSAGSSAQKRQLPDSRVGSKNRKTDSKVSPDRSLGVHHACSTPETLPHPKWL